MGYAFTPYESANPEMLARYQARVAKLKPQCCTCGKVLPTKIAATETKASKRVCRDREACRVRSIFRTPAKTYAWM